jgi:alpha-glucosidase
MAANWVVPGRAVWRYLDNEPAPAPNARGTTRPTTQPASGPATAPTAPPVVPLAAGVGEPPSGTEIVAIAQPTPEAEASVTAPEPTTSPATTRSSTTTASTGPASRPRVTAKEMKLWSELAGKLGFEYSILEGFWASWPDDDLKDLVTSARALNVGIFVWVDSKKLHDPEARKALYKRCVDAGIAGLKVDFFDHEHKETIDLYQAMLKEAAENKLLLDFHGANKPTGTQRTWPNELTREAVRGMEARKIESRATHETTLPFTRFVVGPAEYTGTLFTERRGDTTFAHQVAVPVVFTAPLMTYAAHPQKLIASPASDVIRQIPPVWDQTIVLPPSEIGEVAVFARRLKDQWFLGVLNGKTACELKVPLSFLNGSKYTATFVRDGTKPEEMKVEKELPMSKADTVTIDLPAGGGFVGVFTKKEE